MNIIKTGLPISILALSSLYLTSCTNKNQPQITESLPKTETVIQESGDSFQKQNNEKKDAPWWEKALIGGGLFGLFSLTMSLVQREVDKLKEDPKGARTFLEMNGDYYDFGD